jgi:hypothetical protein
VNFEKGTVLFFVGSVPRTDRLGNGPYISQKSEFRKGDSPLFPEVIRKPLPFIGTVPFIYRDIHRDGSIYAGIVSNRSVFPIGKNVCGYITWIINEPRLLQW